MLILGVVALVLGSTTQLSATPIAIPGKVDHICYHIKYFYNFPNNDFIYYFNDQLLFLDKLMSDINKTKYRKKTLILVYQHRRIKEFLNKHDKNRSTPFSITLNLRDSEEQQQAIQLCNLLGLQLLIRKNNRYMVVPDNSTQALHFYEFAMLKPRLIETQVNKTGKFHFQLLESNVEIPWDLESLTKISGINLTRENFFEHLLKDIRFSLLLGTLYRLSSAEIDYIGSCSKKSISKAWQTIRKSKKNLLGFYILSMALRVNQGQLILPGGEEARGMWSALAKADSRKKPLEFLLNLATMDNGKLNYLYIFTFFLPPQAQTQMLFNYNINKVQHIYKAIRLSQREKIVGEIIPQLPNLNFFTLLYAIQLKDSQINFPGGPALWHNTLARKKRQAMAKIPGPDAKKTTPFDVIHTLLKKNKKDNSLMETFISLYSKFQDRPALLTETTLPLLFDNYQQYNIMVDFIEKVPLKKPESISRLITWVRRTKKLRSNENELFYALYQSLLELMANAAVYGNNNIDYDRIIEKMTAPGLSRNHIYNRLLNILQEDFAIRSTNGDRQFFQFLLGRLFDIDIRYAKNYYLYPIRQNFQKMIQEICSSQEVCSLSSLVQLNDLLSQIATSGQKGKEVILARVERLVEKLPVAEISDMAPKWIRDNFIPYKKEMLLKRIGKLRTKLQKKSPLPELENCVTWIKSNHLIYYLKDCLLATVYATNAKHASLRALINPNLIRLHDFTSTNHKTPWNNSEISRGTQRFQSYHLRGGLARLNIVFSSSYIEHFLNRNTIYDPGHVEGIVYNILDLFPVSGIREADIYVTQLIDFGLELILKGRQNTELRQQILAAIGKQTAGFHYNSIHRYLHGHSKSHNLFLSEIFRLGETFFRKNQQLTQFSASQKLDHYRRPEQQKTIAREMDKFGSLYYKTLGTLKTRQIHFFPLDLASLFRSGYTSGEINKELKFNVTYHAVKRKLSPSLIGQVMLTYFTKIYKTYYNQNYKQDYFSSCFLFNIFNSSYLNRVILTLKKGGQLRIK